MTETSALLDILPQALIVLDDGGNIQSANSAAEEWLNQSEKKLLGQPLSVFISDAPLLALVTQVQQSRKSFRTPEQTIAGQKWMLGILPRPEGGVLLMLDRYAAFPENTQQMLRASGLMAAMLAHEVKNPLAGIRGAAQLLRQNATDADLPLTQIICDEVDRVKGILEQVEIFSDHTALKKHALNIHEVLQRVKSLSDVNVVEQYDPSLPEVSGNKEWLVQLFLNLVKNASEALIETINPVVTFQTRWFSDVKQSGKPMVAVEVMDNGPGVAEEVVSQLFEPFASTRGHGRGLGLSIVSKIASDLGGHVQLTETRLGFTKFTVLLPVA